MRVGIRAHALDDQVGGHANYIRNVIRALATIDPEGDYTLFLNTPLPKGAIPGTEHMRHVVVPPRNVRVRMPYWRHGLTFTDMIVPTGAESLALVRERIDVVHGQLAAPLLFGSRLVLTLHDIAYERYPQFFAPDIVTKLRVRVPLTVRHAAAILTDSEFSKRDIMQRYQVPSERIVVAPLAANPIFHPVHDAARLAAVRERHRTSMHFILCVGDLQPRKNLKTLIDAYVRLRRTDTIRHKLVLVGRKAWLYDDIFAVARASSYADDLVFTGYVSDDDLVALYNAADLFVYPSIFEGFGLPPLEAMACGTPAVTSNSSSLPEVVGDAALMVDPLDAEALASAIAMALGDANLHAQLSMQGLQRAAMFSWEATARTVLDVYRRTAQSSHQSLWISR